MDIKEKSELIDLIKGEINTIAKKEAEGAKSEVSELVKGLETKIQTSLEGVISKSEFDEMENKFRKELEKYNEKQTKEITFESALIKGLNDSRDALSMLQKGSSKMAELDIRKDPGTLTAAGSLGATNAANAFAVFNNREIVPIARRARHVREIIGMGGTDDAVYPFLRETPKEGAVAVQNPEGAEKAQIEYQSNLIFATESTIAAWQDIGRQTLSNVRGLASFIQLTMINDLLIKEDNALLFGAGTNGAVTGIFASGAPLQAAAIPSVFETPDPTIYDAIAAFAATLAAREYIADGAVINPVDYWRMVIEKDKDSRYQQNVVFDSASSMLYVFGIPVIATTAVPVGSLGVMDSRYVMPLQREGISLRFSEENKDNFTKNLVTARVEERILNVVRRTDAFAFDTLTNILTAIDAGS